MAEIQSRGVGPNTLILMGDRTTKQIKDINIGDIITSADRETQELTTEVVTGKTFNMSTELTRINDKEGLLISSNHLIQLDRTGQDDTITVNACNVYACCIIYVYDTKSSKICYTSVFDITKSNIENEMIYNITTSGHNTFIASNYIICN